MENETADEKVCRLASRVEELESSARAMERVYRKYQDRILELEELVAAGHENFHDGWDSTEWRERARKVLSLDALPQADGK